MKTSNINKFKKIYKFLIPFFLVIIVTFIIILIVQSNSDDHKKYVSFDTDGGSIIEKVEIPDNGKISRPVNPTKDNFIFNGWYKDPSFNECIDLASITFMDNTTIYARYTSYFDFAFFENFYTSYLADLEDNTYSNRSLIDYMNNLGQTILTSEILADFIASQIKSTSEPEIRSLFTNEVKSMDLKEIQPIPCDIKTYFNSDGEFYLFNDKYINVNNKLDVRDELGNHDEFDRTHEFYLNKQRTKVFIKVIEKDTYQEKFINVLNSKEEANINILDKASFIGKLKYYEEEFYVDYDPYISGYKTNDFLDYFDDCMNYFLFEKVFSNYYTFQYERFMLQVYYTINPDKENYSKSRLEASKKVVQKIYRNFIDFEKYNKLEEEIQGE